MFYNIRDGLCFDDILIIPRYSDVESRADVDISVEINGMKYEHPIIPANMKTITGLEMAKTIAKSKGLALIHRFMPIEDQIDIANQISIDDKKYIGFSVGIKDEDRKNAKKLYNTGVKIFCIDIAHGDSKLAIDMTKWMKNTFADILLISGNVATSGGAKGLWEAGADVVKCGIGAGSLCSTRIETGCGVPQLTALMDIAETKQILESVIGKKLYTISDGGIRNAGDIVKSLIFSDMVMAGNIFSGCNETPGNVIHIKGKTYKEYIGSSTHKPNHIEGVSAIVPTKGPFSFVLQKMLEGLRSGMSYQGSHNLEELKDGTEFIKITNAGLTESKPHDVIVV